jgi:hypothetical protein
MRYTLPRASSFVETTTSPSFLPSAPDIAPRALCVCHPVAATISGIVTPSGRRSIEISSACFVPVRSVGSFGAWRISDLHLTHFKHSVTAVKPCSHHVPCLHSGGLGPQGAFPYCSNPPACLMKNGLNCRIPHHICIELVRPELEARCRNRGVVTACMAIPEAILFEVDGVILRHHDSRLAGNSFA